MIPSNYSVLYVVGDDIRGDAQGMAGTLTLDEDRLVVLGPQALSFPYAEFRHFEIYRPHCVGTFIRIYCGNESVVVTVPRVNFCNRFVIVNYFKTRRLYEDLRSRILAIQDVANAA